MSPRDMLKALWISPEMLPAADVGAFLPTPDALGDVASCGYRSEVPQSHQIVDRHGEGEHPGHAVAAAMPRLAKQADRLEPPEHFLDPLAESLAHAVARVASGPRVEGGDGLLRHVRGHVERAEARDDVPIIVMLVGAERRAPAPGRRGSLPGSGRRQEEQGLEEADQPEPLVCAVAQRGSRTTRRVVTVASCPTPR